MKEGGGVGYNGFLPVLSSTHVTKNDEKHQKSSLERFGRRIAFGRLVGI